MKRGGRRRREKGVPLSWLGGVGKGRKGRGGEREGYPCPGQGRGGRSTSDLVWSHSHDAPCGRKNKVKILPSPVLRTRALITKTQGRVSKSAKIHFISETTEGTPPMSSNNSINNKTPRFSNGRHRVSYRCTHSQINRYTN